MDKLETLNTTDKIIRLLKEKKAALDFVKRKYDSWTENYELYRNKIFTNRLTQRQDVSIPLMKETIKVLLSKIDDSPNINWKELSGDQQKELIFQEVWHDGYKRMGLELLDIQDKKTVLLYGRSFKKLNWVDGQVEVSALDIYDVVIDPMVNPLDIESARFLIHLNIFRTLDEIMVDDRYTNEGKNKLKSYLLTEEGIQQSSEDREKWRDKMERMKSMGSEQQATDEQMFAASDTIVSLTEHHKKVWDGKKYEHRVITYADDVVELADESLMELLGIDLYPFVTWAEDIETQDFWSDSPADLVRPLNKIINIWFSQLVENRTLRNFQMHWYDASVQGYRPQTYEPGPGRMLPAPGDPNKTIMPVDVSGLDETMNAIDYITNVAEKGSGAISLEKGGAPDRSATLGEIEIRVGKAMERTIAMTKMYRNSWQDFAKKYEMILNANDNSKRTLYKTSNGKIYKKDIYPSDWKSEAGYEAVVSSTSEQDSEQIESLQKFNYVLQQFPSNKALRKIAQNRTLDIIDLTPAEMKEVSQEEEANAKLMEKQDIPLPINPAQPQPVAELPVVAPTQ